MNGKKKEKPLGVEDGGEKADEAKGGGEGEKDKGSTGLALGLCFGSAFGLLVQVITGSVIWLPIGAAAGFGLGFATGGAGKKGK